jgi:cytochrome c5
MSTKHLAFCVYVLAGVSALALAAQQGSAPRAKPSKDPAPQGTVQPQSDGERVFQQNCSRCHTPPDGFSPRISGTVVRHMRVRASLSKHDEEALLQYFNP